MLIEDEEESKSIKKGKMSIQSSRSGSVGSSTTTTTTTNTGRSRKAPKVTQSDFSPRTNRLANLGKTFLRERVATDGAFPSTLERDKYIWETVQSSTKANKALQDAFEAAGEDEERKKQLIEYVEYSIVSYLLWMLRYQ
jgi:hypothetical protein